MTLFSAPDYPQFQAGPRSENMAAVATLSPPEYCSPKLQQFAACPHPPVRLAGLMQCVRKVGWALGLSIRLRFQIAGKSSIDGSCF
jgi:hypothetical protein